MFLFVCFALLWVPLGSFGVPLGSFWGALGLDGGALGLRWGVLWPSLGVLESFRIPGCSHTSIPRCQRDSPGMQERAQVHPHVRLYCKQVNE